MNGIMNIYKEREFTSHDVVAVLRGITHQKKIGHTGTLDPMAEGVLPVCLGNATKLCDMMTDKSKVYEATLLLGKKTDTQDIWGTVISENTEEELNALNSDKISDAILSFAGEYEQVPPMYSAKKVDGRKLYDLARQGVEIERKPVKVTIDAIDIISIELPRIYMRVHCQKGTYIRTLCEDIAAKLGVHGCMEKLLRTQVGPFSIESAIKISQVEDLLNEGAIEKAVLPTDFFFADLPEYVVSPSKMKFLQNGNKLSDCAHEYAAEGARIRMYSFDHVFTGIYEWSSRENLWVPFKMFF